MQRLVFVFLFLLAVSVGFARPFMVLFGSQDCDECAELKELWSDVDEDVSSDSTRPVMIYVCIDDSNNYFYLKRLEKVLSLKRPGSSFPFLLIGNRLYAGRDGFYSAVPNLQNLVERTPSHPLLAPLRKLADSATEPVVVWNATEEFLNQNSEGTSGKKEDIASAVSQHSARLLYLATPGCQKCARQETELKFLKEKMPSLTIDKFMVSEDDGLVQMERVVKFFKLKTEPGKNLAPLVAWDNGITSGYITGRLAEIEELMEVLRAPGKVGAAPFWSVAITDAERQALHNRQADFLKHSTWLTTIAAGLIDGINPCAFATVIFLVSYLLYLKRGRRYILGVGLCFCCGVFAAYLLFGVGLSFLVDYLARFQFIKRIVYAIFALVGFVLFALHLRDAVRFRRSGRVQDMDMGLNAQTHNKIHKKIHRWAEMSSCLAFPAAILLGCVVSSMEFVCTGQVYLPMIMAINASGFNAQAFQWLLLYNVAFILPLLLVTFLAYSGVGAKAISKWAQTHVFATKIAMAALFLAIGVLMLMLL